MKLSKTFDYLTDVVVEYLNLFEDCDESCKVPTELYDPPVSLIQLFIAYDLS